MELLLDSTDPKEVEEVKGWGLICGITTNPSHYAGNAADFKARLRELIEVSPGYVFTQAMGWHDKDELVRQAYWLIEQSEKIVVKLPISIAGIQALQEVKKNQPQATIAITAVASVGQALLCGMAGADIVALFNGPLDETSDQPVEVVRPVKQIYTSYGYQTKILSCCRYPRGVGEFAAAGTDMATMRKQYMELLYQHPFTDKRMLGFFRDWKGAYGDARWPSK